MGITDLPALGEPCVVTTLHSAGALLSRHRRRWVTSGPVSSVQASLVCAFASACARPQCLSPVCLFIYAFDLCYRRFKGTYKDT